MAARSGAAVSRSAQVVMGLRLGSIGVARSRRVSVSVERSEASSPKSSRVSAPNRTAAMSSTNSAATIANTVMRASIARFSFGLRRGDAGRSGG